MARTLPRRQECGGTGGAAARTRRRNAVGHRKDIVHVIRAGVGVKRVEAKVERRQAVEPGSVGRTVALRRLAGWLRLLVGGDFGAVIRDPCVGSGSGRGGAHRVELR